MYQYPKNLFDLHLQFIKIIECINIYNIYINIQFKYIIILVYNSISKIGK